MVTYVASISWLLKKNPGINIGMHISFWISVLIFLENAQKWNSFDHMIILFLIFWEISILFSIVAAPIYIPVNSVWGFPFLYSLSNTYYFLSVDNSPSNGCELISPSGFDLHFPDD